MPERKRVFFWDVFPNCFITELKKTGQKKYNCQQFALSHLFLGIFVSFKIQVTYERGTRLSPHHKEIVLCHTSHFYRTQVSLGSGLWVPAALVETLLIPTQYD